MVDGVKGDSQIATIFEDKYERLFNSVRDVESEAELQEKKTFTQRQIPSVINQKHVGNVSVCTVIALIVLTSQLQKKLKSDKVNDNGLVYSNNF